MGSSVLTIPEYRRDEQRKQVQLLSTSYAEREFNFLLKS